MYILKTKTKNNTKTNTKNVEQYFENTFKSCILQYKREQILFSREVDIVLCTASQAVGILVVRETSVKFHK